MAIVFTVIGVLLAEYIILVLYDHNWDKGLEARVNFEDNTVSEGDTGYIAETLVNRKILPLPVVNVTFQLDKSISYYEKINTSVSDRQYRSDSMSLMPYRQLCRRFKVTYNHRGMYAISSVGISTRDVFYNYNLAYDIPCSTQIYVYPSYSTNSQLAAPFSRLMGEAVNNRFLYEDPFEFKGIQEYTGTEPMKKINWSVSARSGRLMVNNYYNTNSRHITIFLDIFNDQIWRQDELSEENIRICRNYLENFVKNNVPVTIVTNGIDAVDGNVISFEEGMGAGFIESCLKKLARIDMSQVTTRFEEYFKLHSAADNEMSVLLSANSSPELSLAYQHYLGKSSGEWLITIRPGGDRPVGSGQIHVTYVEVAG